LAQLPSLYGDMAKQTVKILTYLLCNLCARIWSIWSFIQPRKHTRECVSYLCNSWGILQL